MGNLRADAPAEMGSHVLSQRNVASRDVSEISGFSKVGNQLKLVLFGALSVADTKQSAGHTQSVGYV